VIVVVADASPLIALERIGQLGLLKALFEEVLIPPAVAGEVAPRLLLPPWIRERALQQPVAWSSRSSEGSSPLCAQRSSRCYVRASGRIRISSSASSAEPARA
jgi:hypothetical protein